MISRWTRMSGIGKTLRGPAWAAKGRYGQTSSATLANKRSAWPVQVNSQVPRPLTDCADPLLGQRQGVWVRQQVFKGGLNRISGILRV